MHPLSFRVVLIAVSIILIFVFLRQFATISIDDVYQFSQPVLQENGEYAPAVTSPKSESGKGDSKAVEHASAAASASATTSEDSKCVASSSPTAQPTSADVGIVSMLYGKPNEYYVKAIETHERHAARHGYPSYILRSNVYPLHNGVWNKLAYLLHLLVAELQKPEQERTKWLMWVDADSIVVNPALSLDIFLPPKDFSNVHVLATKDMNGLNAGVFFLRVHHWSIQMIIKAISIPQHLPHFGLGYLEQTALYKTFNDTEFRESVIYEPRIWFNTYEFHHAYEGKHGDFQVHMPGLGKDRWPHMEKWLNITSGPEQAEWELPVEETRYPKETKVYWNTLRYVRAVLNYAEYREKKDSPAKDVKEAVEDLRVTFLYASDAYKKLKEKAEKVHKMFEDHTGNGTEDSNHVLKQLGQCRDDLLGSSESDTNPMKGSCHFELDK
ncbi:hypothetical protein LTR10_017583 [Elasticomyces elasticus]|uniref:Galactosyl transferase GMA12/MNN10 family protein n=1 Tax=Exophiala sideris TaxID=1016849 RepID=A0ABR0JP05_9EURO|nr:hypothetical protein LTR10_017583 [Elasticomyces elasticus]KAK5038229.1 hypothetical protein LTS07_001698 [Exophiala sideris]KAK5044213.1 hypothetical protein LTR13_000569 [Exophiala sideris]KAK5067713.1 hypothetical protein LTR69_001702 [Exophiala sideris]KAK5184047.1 hypothetical protein LTR44_003553 [Eurotiomycetes sp. CCFEE 6388]